jgi:RNA polymerase sigma factor (sigma-70 family)
MTARLLAELLERRGPALRLFARQWTAQPDDAVQDALVKLAGLRQTPDDVPAWLFRATKHAAIDRGKAEARRRQREAAVAKPETWFAAESLDGLDATTAVEALQTLPAEQREIIVARLWGGLSLDQAAQAAGCSVSSAHRRYEAGVNALRERLGAVWPTT